MERKKTYVEDVSRAIYDIKNKFDYRFKTDKGLTPEIIKEISKEKNEPQWMTDFRLKSLEIYNSKPVPTWGVDLTDLDIDEIIAYIRPDADMKTTWDEVPEDIKDTFERLGIPQAERESLAGVGAQYDSEVVYHNIKQELVDQGVIYTDIETALVEYEDILKEYFMKLVPQQIINLRLYTVQYGLAVLSYMYQKV